MNCLFLACIPFKIKMASKLPEATKVLWEQYKILRDYWGSAHENRKNNIINLAYAIIDYEPSFFEKVRAVRWLAGIEFHEFRNFCQAVEEFVDLALEKVEEEDQELRKTVDLALRRTYEDSR